jgi:uncharacterized protein involved in exopolysaccharide biosynthesis
VRQSADQVRGWEQETTSSVSLRSLLYCLWNDRRLLAGAALGMGVLVAAVVLLLPRAYRSTSSFIPSAARSTSGLAGVAAQLGMGLAGGDAAQSPAFYAALVRSRETLSSLATDSLLVDGRRTTLATAWGDAKDAPALRVESAVQRLEQQIDVDVDPRTGLVNLAVESPDAATAQAIAESLLSLVNRFNLERRQTQASNERRFTEARLVQVKSELAQAEARLQNFLDRNRVVAQASSQRFEGERLQREVTVRRGVLEALSQSYEQARLDEVRDTPVITVVDRPARALLPAPRGLLAKTFLGVILGLLLGITASWGRDAWRRLSGTHQSAPVPRDPSDAGQGEVVAVMSEAA